MTDPHLLVVPKRHIDGPWNGIFAMFNPQEWVMLHNIMKRVSDYLYGLERQTDGMNLLVNMGKGADQSVFHLHIQVLPREVDDSPSEPWSIRYLLGE